MSIASKRRVLCVFEFAENALPQLTKLELCSILNTGSHDTLGLFTLTGSGSIDVVRLRLKGDMKETQQPGNV
jgi:hypothetical protein